MLIKIHLESKTKLKPSPNGLYYQAKDISLMMKAKVMDLLFPWVKSKVKDKDTVTLDTFQWLLPDEN